MTRKAVGIALAVIFGLLFVSFLDGAQSTAVAAEAGEKPAANGAPSGDKAPAKAPEKAVTFDPASLPKVVASVNGVEISRTMFARILKDIVADMSARNDTLTEEKLKTIENNVLGQMVHTELFLQEAKANKMKADEKVVEKQYDGFKARFGSEDEFKKWMGQQATTAAEIKDNIREDLTIRALIEERVLKGVKVTEADAQKYYNGNKNMFQAPEMIRARHIIIRLEPDADKEKKDAAAKKMAEIQAKLKAGEKFEDLAKQYGEDSTKALGGDLGLRPRGALVKEFEDVAFALKAGQVSGVVTTQFGLHLIKLEEKKPAGIMAFKDVKDDVVRGLEADAKRQKMVQYLADLKAKAKIVRNL
ncbi:MAG: peptidylprolyl isomerase [Nitrospinae bacterium]|nr:peptidylprolyl isomerase [Nitrospinota bacterium]